MKKILIISTMLALTALLVLGIYAPSSAPMLLASTGEEYIYVRAGLMMILVSLLLYKPPRSFAFRMLLAGIAAILSITTVSMIYTYNIELLDAMLFIETALLISIEAAELGLKKESPAWERSKSRALKGSKLQAI